jgi:hypothetical protein
MLIDPRPATTKNPPKQFTGDVWLDPIAYPCDPGQHMVVAKVRFAPGARTAWHSHVLGQTLHVTQGVAWVQSVAAPRSRLRPDRRSTARRVKSTGTAQQRTPSWSTSRCSTTPRILRRPPPGSTT